MLNLLPAYRIQAGSQAGTPRINLQKQFSDKLSAGERDLLRADMVRERLKNVSQPIAKPTPPNTGN
jgi:hypothetical protein